MNNPTTAIDELLREAINHHQRGELDQAEKGYQDVLQAMPQHPDACHLLGVVAKAKGQVDVAIKNISKAIMLAPSQAPYYSNLGLCYLDRGEKVTAEVCIRRAVSLDPGFVDGWNNLGLALYGLHRFDAALAAWQEARKLDSHNPRILTNIGMVYFETGRHTEALPWYEQALSLDSNSASACIGKAACLNLLGRQEEALELIDRVPRLDLSRIGEAMQKKAAILATLGRLDEACEALDAGISACPTLVELVIARSAVRKIASDDPFFGVLKKWEDWINSLSGEPKAKIAYALAKGYQDIGDIATAAKWYAIGAHTMEGEVVYDERQIAANYAAIQKSVDEKFIRDSASKGTASDRPIFILGMPRSGTTLAEQILASHPDVHPGGELRYLSECLESYPLPAHDKEAMADNERTTSNMMLAERGRQYLSNMAALPGASERKHVTDKMPGNFIHVGLIAAMFPDASIIHCRRDPIDTCLSCYTLLFSEGQYWSYDFKALGRYYRMYWEMMEHWRQVAPGRMFELRYEQLIADTEGSTRALLEWCRLPWDGRVLKHHETKRIVSTASVGQVRQPIYKSSVGRWKKWKPFIQPLLDEIGDLEIAYWDEIGIKAEL